MNIKDTVFQNIKHSCLDNGGEVNVENAYLTGKQEIEPDLILEATCSKCGLVLAKNYVDNHWVLV